MTLPRPFATVSETGRRRFAATALFFAFTAPCGIAAHLISELVGLGWHDDQDVAFSARHGYLALIALASLAVVVAVLCSVPRARRRARIAELVDALPFRGSGLGFTLVSFGAQFGFFAVSQIGEGCPLCSGDVVVGVFAAAVAALLGAIVLGFGKRRILELALALVQFLDAALGGAPSLAPSFSRRRAAAKHARRSPFAFRYRPPPASRAT